MTVYILNSPILTSFGRYVYRPISVEEARSILLAEGFVSAVGHEGTANLLSNLLGVSIPANRIAITMKPGDKALVFQLLHRLPEGRVLSVEELKAVPYRLGLLEMLGEEV
jgi:hypothetical protein